MKRGAGRRHARPVKPRTCGLRAMVIASDPLDVRSRGHRQRAAPSVPGRYQSNGTGVLVGYYAAPSGRHDAAGIRVSGASEAWDPGSTKVLALSAPFPPGQPQTAPEHVHRDRPPSASWAAPERSLTRPRACQVAGGSVCLWCAEATVGTRRGDPPALQGTLGPLHRQNAKGVRLGVAEQGWRPDDDRAALAFRDPTGS
jgi:hypothetical protein